MSVVIQVDFAALAAFTPRHQELNASYDRRRDEYDAGSEKVQWIAPGVVADLLKPHLEKFRHAAAINHVDIGCGTGAVSKELRARSSQNIYSIGIDPSRGILEKAVQLGLIDEAHQRLATQLDGVLADESQHIVTSVGVLDHLTNGEVTEVANQFVRVARPGAVFAVTFEDDASEHPGAKNNSRFNSSWLAEQFSNSGKNKIEIETLNPAWYLGKSRRPVENKILVGHVPNIH